jgi:hypothetical protein
MEQEIETFSLELKTHPINLKQKDGSVELHEVREMSGIERDRYLKSVTRRRRGNNTNNMELENIQADLIVKSLFRVSDNRQYKIEEIERFPSSLQKRLYDIAQDLSALTSKDEKKREQPPKGNSETDDDSESENDEDGGDSKN